MDDNTLRDFMQRLSNEQRELFWDIVDKVDMGALSKHDARKKLRKLKIPVEHVNKLLGWEILNGRD